MKTRSIAVIGANYGDEGKGKIVDALARELGPMDTVVMRYNSGAQAGHTVEWERGGITFRHAFGHFGSGAAAGAKTFLGSKFVVNPLLFRKELNELRVKGLRPFVACSMLNTLSTPYEMLFNQKVEAARGAGKHGSCGVGFGQTIKREKSQITATVADMKSDPNGVLDRCREFFFLSCECVGIDPKDTLDSIDETKMRLDFCDSFDEFIDSCSFIRADLLFEKRHVIFEAAQGLLLDATRGSFPHVTHTNTGVSDAAYAAMNNGRVLDSAIYVSRTYLTRHGVGPLPGEEALYDRDGVSLVSKDSTNVTNAFQDSLRTARLNVVTLQDRILTDSQNGAFGRAALAMTWLDWKETNDGLIGYRGRQNDIFYASGDSVASIVASCGLPIAALGHGPHFSDIELINI